MKNLLNKIINGYTILEVANSKLNGPIEVREDIFGKRTMVAGCLAQSGKEVEKIWSEAIQQFNNLTINNCLILGLGAGTVAKLLIQKYPDAKMTGIEIDPEIIKMGNKYFNLSKIKNLEIKVTDAISEVNNITIKQYNNYDLVLVDLYLGNQYPKEAGSSSFLISLKKLLTEDGHIIFNRLYYHESEKQETDKFGNKLREIFNQVNEREIGWNKFFFVR